MSGSVETEHGNGYSGTRDERTGQLTKPTPNPPRHLSTLPWKTAKLPSGERQDTYAVDSLRVGWPSGKGVPALGMQLRKNEDGMLCLEEPSSEADVVDGVPSHAGTAPVDYSGHGKRGKQPHAPTSTKRDTEANTLGIVFAPLTESHRSDHATTAVIFVTSDNPPVYQGATLVSVDGETVMGDVPVPQKK